MRRLTRRERVAAGLWIVVSLIVWNLIYDLMVTRGVQEFMFRAALHEAGRGPRTTMAEVLDRNVDEAIWVSTLFASLVALAGFFTIRYMHSTQSHHEPRTPPPDPRQMNE
jgi:hypothetical protein